jgi:hypothetical protein
MKFAIRKKAIFSTPKVSKVLLEHFMFKQKNEFIEKQALIGSSETTREPPLYLEKKQEDIQQECTDTCQTFNFYDFEQYHRPLHKQTIDYSFLEWLIGFTEGDGTFSTRKICEPTGQFRLSFEIRQKSYQTLYKIKKELGFGSIYFSNEDSIITWRYRVEDRRNLQRIMSLFNGNLILPKRQRQFDAWIKKAKPIHHPTFIPRYHKAQISLKNAWLSGFIDSEGCFYATFTTPSQRSLLAQRFYQKMHITQQNLCGEKEVLAKIGSLLKSNAKVCLARLPDCYRIEICSLTSHSILINYLEQFPLKEKAMVFRRWWRIYNLRVEGRHLNEKGIKRMKKLCQALQKKD